MRTLPVTNETWKVQVGILLGAEWLLLVRKYGILPTNKNDLASTLAETLVKPGKFIDRVLRREGSTHLCVPLRISIWAFQGLTRDSGSERLFD